MPSVLQNPNNIMTYIIDKQNLKIEEIAQRYCLKLVLLFGSQSSGRVHKESDVDIAYIPDKSLDFNQEYHLNYEFTKVFQKDRVDTVDIKKANPLLMYAVFQHPRILFQSDESIFSQYRTYAFKRYIEAKPLYEEKARRLREHINIMQS